MSARGYTFFADLAAEAPPPQRGILSQTLSDEGGVEVVMFAMARGERLSEHTSARPAIIHVLSGSGTLTVSSDEHGLQPGSWLRMAAGAAHALTAITDLVFVLYLLAKE